MKLNIENLVRQNIRELKPYTSARSLYSGGEATLLDANENGDDPFGEGLNRYPDPLQKELKKEISKIKKVAPENIFLGNGSDEAIDLLFRIFCEPGVDEIITCPPTYGMYRVQANIHNTPIIEVPLDESFDLRPEAILAAVSSKTKLLFLCSPNNPTGNILSAQKMEKLIREFPGIVVVDEAYIDFAEQQSWSKLLNECTNLVVLQTLSKAWALAGARLGMAFANAEIMHYLNAVKFPYNVSQPTQKAALSALKKGELQASVSEILLEKDRMAERLTAMEFVEKIYPSDANFLLVKFKASDAVFQYLRERKIIVRNRSKELNCSGCLRLTVGTKAENDLLLSTLISMPNFQNEILQNTTQKQTSKA